MSSGADRGGERAPGDGGLGPERPEPVGLVGDERHAQAFGDHRDVEAVAGTRAVAGSGTHTSPLHAPSGFTVHPVRVFEVVGRDRELRQQHGANRTGRPGAARRLRPGGLAPIIRFWNTVGFHATTIEGANR